MDFEPLKTILIAGVNTRPIVKSAKKLGFETIAVDRFNDIDLRKYADHLYSLENVIRKGKIDKFRKEKYFELIHGALESHNVDAVILTSGLEHEYEKIRKLEKRTSIIGNESDRLKFSEDTEKLFSLADKLGIPHPDTEKVENLDEALQAAADIGYPVLLKPSRSGGGIGIRLAEGSREVEDDFDEVTEKDPEGNVYVQQYIRGINASASVISNGKESRCLSVNEQIIGDKSLNVPRKFGYCGNIIPLSAEDGITSKISKYSETICSEFGVVGSNGVDFIIGDKPYLVEVNPRFQNTIDMIEGSFDLNLLKMHIESTEGKLPEKKDLKRSSTKLIIYAKRDMRAPKLNRLSTILDIPRKNSKIEKEEPICSILKFGEKRDKTTEEAYKLARKVQQKCYRASR